MSNLNVLPLNGSGDVTLPSVSLENTSHDFSPENAGKFNSDLPSGEQKTRCGACCESWRDWGWMTWICVAVAGLCLLFMLVGLFMGFAGNNYVSTIGGIFMIVSVCFPAFLLLCYGVLAVVTWGIDRYHRSREVTVI